MAHYRISGPWSRSSRHPSQLILLSLLVHNFHSLSSLLLRFHNSFPDLLCTSRKPEKRSYILGVVSNGKLKKCNHWVILSFSSLLLLLIFFLLALLPLLLLPPFSRLSIPHLFAILVFISFSSFLILLFLRVFQFYCLCLFSLNLGLFVFSSYYILFFYLTDFLITHSHVFMLRARNE